jgi:DNA-binding beta-propeller fold protein YncE
MTKPRTAGERKYGLAKALAVAAITLALTAPTNAATLLLGTYPDKMFTVDEATGTVKERIQLEAGLPTSMRMSNDKSRIYVTTITTSGIAVLDAKTRKVLNQFSLNTPTTRYRFNGGVPDPTGRYFYTQLIRFDKQPDRYIVSKPMYAVIDLQKKAIVRTAEVDDEDDTLAGMRSTFMLSPDGKTFYLFRDKVLMVDTTTLKVVDRFDLAKAETTGMENVSFQGGVEALQNPNEYVSLFNASDPYIHNKVFGLGRFDLTNRSFNFSPIGPIPNGMTGLEISPDGKQGYTVVTNGTTGNKRCEFWHFEMQTMKLADKAEFPCRSRFTLGMSGDGQKLYIYGASYDIEVYDAKTLKLDKTWDLSADATMAGLLILQ